MDAPLVHSCLLSFCFLAPGSHSPKRQHVKWVSTSKYGKDDHMALFISSTCLSLLMIMRFHSPLTWKTHMYRIGIFTCTVLWTFSFISRTENIQNEQTYQSTVRPWLVDSLQGGFVTSQFYPEVQMLFFLPSPSSPAVCPTETQQPPLWTV